MWKRLDAAWHHLGSCPGLEPEGAWVDESMTLVVWFGIGTLMLVLGGFE